MKQLVSVVMCAYNEGRYIGEAIESILRQTYSNLELVVVNDGSTDRTWKIISAFSDDRLKQINQGRMEFPADLNVGLIQASGEIIAKLDADDIALPNRLELQVRCLEENPDVALVGTFARYQDPDGRPIIPLVSNSDVPGSNKEIRKYMLRDSPLGSSSVAFRREVLNSVDSYNKNAGYVEDYDFWVRIAARYRIAIIPEVTVIYRVRPDSLSRSQRHSDAIWRRLQVQLLAAKLIGPVPLALPYLCRSLVGFAGYRVLEALRSRGGR